MLTNEPSDTSLPSSLPTPVSPRLPDSLFVPLSVKVGQLLFRYRSFIPLPWICLLLFFPAEHLLPLSQIVFCFLLIGCSEGVRLWAVGYAGSVTRTRGVSVPRLVRDGPYRFTRNPLYLSNLVMYTSIAFYV